jgi:hypothetical protein
LDEDSNNEEEIQQEEPYNPPKSNAKQTMDVRSGSALGRARGGEEIDTCQEVLHREIRKAQHALKMHHLQLMYL